MRWKKVTLVGVGLLGGSLGLALRNRRLADRVVGFVRREASLSECCEAGAVDEATLDLAAAVKDADLIVLCTPISQMVELVKKMLPTIRRGAIATDVGSVKGSVTVPLTKLLDKAGSCFVGSHPMAGSERTGVSAASPDLFEGATCVITPIASTNPRAVRRIEACWCDVGARTLRLSPEIHDALVSRSSHLPHVVAAALANCVLDPRHPKEQASLCATGFRDTTRIASGSPAMWRDIALANRKNLRRALSAFGRTLQELDRALATGDPDAVEAFLTRAKSRRDDWRANGASQSPE